MSGAFLYGNFRFFLPSLDLSAVAARDSACDAEVFDAAASVQFERAGRKQRELDRGRARVEGEEKSRYMIILFFIILFPKEV